MSAPAYPFVKGHGTENDFVLLPDHDGSVHGDLSAERVRALCDRRAGIGADGVLRVIRTAAIADAAGQPAEWFMDYRNSDGSLSQMCGNGIRVFVRHLLDEGMIEPVAGQVTVGTRDGVKSVTIESDGQLTVDLGVPRLLGETKVEADGRAFAAVHVDIGNPHAVAFVDNLDDAGSLLDQPRHDVATYPEGVNVEFVVRRGPGHLAFRVHERGSGETRSCGTGAGAVLAAAATADGATLPVEYAVDVPGGRLRLTWTADRHALLTGPAQLVARGTSHL